jgi:hypothetical protein
MEIAFVMPSDSEIQQYKENLRGEIDGIALYRLLADAERDAERAAIFRDLAAAEERHAGLWRRKLEEAGVEVADGQRPSLRIRIIGWLARRLGPRAVLPIVNALETGDYGSYLHQGGDAVPLAHEERAHGRAMTRLAGLRSPRTSLDRRAGTVWVAAAPCAPASSA